MPRGKAKRKRHAKDVEGGPTKKFRAESFVPSPASRPGGWSRPKAGHGELKFVDTESALTTVTTAGVGFLFATIPQGDTVNSRVGNMAVIQVMRALLEISPVLPMLVTEFLHSVPVRCLLVRDRANNAAATIPNLSEILDNSVISLYKAKLRLDVQHRFDIVKDETMWITRTTDTSTDAGYVEFTYAPMKDENRKIMYNTGTTTGAQGTLTQNAYYYYVVTSSNAIVTVTVSSRTRFYDGAGY